MRRATRRRATAATDRPLPEGADGPPERAGLPEGAGQPSERLGLPEGEGPPSEGAASAEREARPGRTAPPQRATPEREAPPQRAGSPERTALPERAGDPSGQPAHEGKRALIAALAANLGIAITKFVAFAITGSASMLAESVHSLADSGNEVLLLVGRTRARRDETREHPFGFGSERYFYTFIVAVVLFTVGAVYSCYEGAQRISHPERLTTPAVAFGVLGVAAVLEGASLRTAMREARPSRGRASWGSFIRRSKIPELPAVLLEDVAALSGLLLALIGVTLATLTHDDRWDGAGSIGVGLVLAAVAVVLAIEMKSLLIGESASPDTESAIVAAIQAGSDVHRVIHLRTLHVGPDTLLVAAKVAVRHDETAASIAAGIDAAERRIRAAVPIAELIFLEPDLYQAGRVDPDDPAIQAASQRVRRSGTASTASTASASAGGATDSSASAGSATDSSASATDSSATDSSASGGASASTDNARDGEAS
jgi:cation diffusion facilitator family transporter